MTKIYHLAGISSLKGICLRKCKCRKKCTETVPIPNILNTIKEGEEKDALYLSDIYKFSRKANIVVIKINNEWYDFLEVQRGCYKECGKTTVKPINQKILPNPYSRWKETIEKAQNNGGVVGRNFTNHFNIPASDVSSSTNVVPKEKTTSVITSRQETKVVEETEKGNNKLKIAAIGFGAFTIFSAVAITISKSKS